MPEIRHVTTRRSFITGMGFGAVGLYGVWAAYGAAPLPFGNPRAIPAADGHGGHGGGMTPETFRRAHAAFIERFKRPDGSVEPLLSAIADPGIAHSQMAHHDTAHHDMAAHDMTAHDMAHHDMGAPHDSGHAGAGHSGHDGGGDQPVDLYLLAFMWGYNPDTLHLRTGVRYRLRLLADDIPHGASLQLGSASRIIRLRPDVVGEQNLTFTKPGTVLVYCTAFCGQGHDQMRGKIIVTTPEAGSPS